MVINHLSSIAGIQNISNGLRAILYIANAHHPLQYSIQIGQIINGYRAIVTVFKG